MKKKPSDDEILRVFSYAKYLSSLSKDERLNQIKQMLKEEEKRYKKEMNNIQE